jgi:hypothetical protein
MTHHLHKRLVKVENAIIPPQDNSPLYLHTMSHQIGLDGETLREETDSECIAKHLALHPQDAGREFKIINRVFISPKGKDSEGNNVW